MTDLQKRNINNIILETPYYEDDKTKALLGISQTIKEQGYLNKKQAIDILKWKSPRPLQHYIKNSDTDFQNITKLSFAQKDEKVKIHILTALVGVKYPSASAFLMFYDCTQYPIIDIRVWTQLYKNGLVNDNPSGQAFTLQQWFNYLTIIRQIAKDNGFTARQVEKHFYEYDRITQEGSLYKYYTKRV